MPLDGNEPEIIEPIDFEAEIERLKLEVETWKLACQLARQQRNEWMGKALDLQIDLTISENNK